MLCLSIKKHQQIITCLLQLRDQNQTPNHQRPVVQFATSSSILLYLLFSPSCLPTCLPFPLLQLCCLLKVMLDNDLPRVCSFMCIYFQHLTPPTISEDHPTAVFFPTSCFCQFPLLWNSFIARRWKDCLDVLCNGSLWCWSTVWEVS